MSQPKSPFDPWLVLIGTTIYALENWQRYAHPRPTPKHEPEVEAARARKAATGIGSRI